MRPWVAGAATRSVLAVVALSALGTGASQIVSGHPAGARTLPTVPGAPTDVQAFPSPLSAGVNWDRPSSDGGAAITRYEIRATDLTDPARGGQKTTSVCCGTGIGGLTPNDKYTFRVSATNSAGTGPPSAPSNAVVVEPAPPPAGVYCEHVSGTTSGVVTVGSCHYDATVRKSRAVPDHGTVRGRIFVPGKTVTGTITWTSFKSYSTTVSTKTLPDSSSRWCVARGYQAEYTVQGKVAANTNPDIAVGQPVSATICISASGAVVQSHYGNLRL